MKYVSAANLNLQFSKETEKAMCFVSGGRTFWIPKTQIRIGSNAENDFAFFIKSRFYMESMRHKFTNPYTTHFEELAIKSNFSEFLNPFDKEVVFA